MGPSRAMCDCRRLPGRYRRVTLGFVAAPTPLIPPPPSPWCFDTPVPPPLAIPLGVLHCICSYRPSEFHSYAPKPSQRLLLFIQTSVKPNLCAIRSRKRICAIKGWLVLLRVRTSSESTNWKTTQGRVTDTLTPVTSSIEKHGRLHH